MSRPALAEHPVYEGVGVKALTVGGQVKRSLAPEPTDLELINGYAIVPLKAADVAVYTMQVANDQVDRDVERFSPEVLADFAETLVGKSLLQAHDWGAPAGIGRFYRAWTTNENGTTWLMAKAYLLRQDPDAAEMIVKLDGGVASFISVGFYCPDKVFVQDAQGNAYGEYRRGPNGEKAEAIEASLVFLGAQYDAAVIKGVTDRIKAARDKAHESGERGLIRKILEAVGLVSKQGRVLSEANLNALRQAVDLSDRADTLVQNVIAAAVPVVAEPGKAADEQAADDKVVDNTAAPAAEAAAHAAAVTIETKGDEAMTPEQIEQFKAEVKSMIDAAVAEVKASNEALLKQVGELAAEQKTQGETLKAATEDVSVEEFGAKLLDRIENIEAVLGAPKAAAAEPEPESDEAKAAAAAAAAKGKKKGVFGDLIVPAELRA